jgi:hypothetical protein
LHIDPAVLVYSGYIGGSGLDFGQRIAVDAVGNAYIVGDTFSVDLPVKEGGLVLENLPRRREVFVAKVNAAGNALVYAGYLGGTNHDFSGGIAVDMAQNVYVAGGTQSLDFPTTVGSACVGSIDPVDTTHVDGFLTKINPAGDSLVYSRCIGGTIWDRAFGGSRKSPGQCVCDWCD